MGKKNILHIIDNLALGGAETLLVGVVNQLTNKNIIVTLDNRNEFISPINATLYCLNYKNRLDTLAAVLKLRKIIKNEQIDIVHAHLPLSTFIARLACPKNIKFIFSVHNKLSESAFKESPLTYILEKLTYSSRHHAIFVSETARKDYDKTIGIKGKSDVLYNYIDDSFFENRKKNYESFNNRFVAVGNLKQQKNYTTIINGFNRLKNKSFTLDIYGKGGLKGNLQQQIIAYNLQNNIYLKGMANNINTLVPKYDVFIIGSLYEGFGIALLEAMALGVPCIASDIEVFREVAQDNVVYFNPNDENDLAAKLNLVIEDKTLRLKNVVGAKKHAEEISKKNPYLKKLIQIYNECN